MIRDVDPVAAHLRLAVAAAAGPAGVNEDPITGRGSAAPEPVVAQGVDHPEEPSSATSGLALGVGYLVAGFGTLLMGLLVDATGG